jgi:serine/threonine-protein kinase
MGRPTDDCLDEQTVVDFAAGALPADRAAAAEKHLAGCDRCAELVATAVMHAHGTTGDGAPTVPEPPSDAQSTVVVEALAHGYRALPLLEPGTTLGDSYRVLRFIGRGAMGEVYEVAHARLAGRYAAKLLSLDPRSNPQAFSRFRREAMIASGLSHPNVLQVIDFRQLPDGRPYLVTEYLEGEDLAHVLVTGPLPLPRTMHLVRQMVSALSTLHAHQVIHRDLKPQNIFVLKGMEGEPERVKLLDFGLAKRSNPSLVVTHDRALLGTPQYMAPEQALGNPDTLGPESDQFSLAAIVYEMLGGRPPFAGDALSIVLYRIVHEAPPALAKLAPHLPAHVVAAVQRGLAKRREERFPSVKAFLQALEPEGAAAGTAAPRGPATRRRAGRGVVTVAAAVLAGGAIAGALVLRERPAPPAATATMAAAPAAAAAATRTTTTATTPTTTVNMPEPAPIPAPAALSATTEGAEPKRAQSPPPGERPRRPKGAQKKAPASSQPVAAPAGATPAPAAAPEQPEPHLIDKL